MSPVLSLGTSGHTSGGTFAYENSLLECPESRTGSSTGTSGKPEVPACSAVLPMISSGATSGTSTGVLLLFSGSCTGSDTGTTAKTEVPALPAELPLLWVCFLLSVYRWGAALRRAVVPPYTNITPTAKRGRPTGAEVPPVVPVLPV